ncbi:MAG TPA: hypothetical protein VMI33_11640 [Streptosporangiaceae bacterium]|nr:hypothetical protein [Streptosporangiaceae bacterium]
MHSEQESPPAAWQRLRSEVGAQAPMLSAPPPAAGGLCPVCRGPGRPGQARCYQCDLYGECLPGLMPDVVAPVAYAVKGGPHATNLWLYKSGRPGAAAARAALLGLLLVYLRDHGRCVWRRAGMARPTHVAVVPSRRGRPAPHPLQELAAPYLTLRWARLALARRDDPPAHDPDPSLFRSAQIPGARVLLLDDTWTTGASAVSAAAALRLAGARSVAVIVLGRHLDAGPAAAGRGFSPEAMPFRPWLCAVHLPGRTQ